SRGVCFRSCSFVADCDGKCSVVHTGADQRMYAAVNVRAKYAKQCHRASWAALRTDQSDATEGEFHAARSRRSFKTMPRQGFGRFRQIGRAIWNFRRPPQPDTMPALTFL